MKTYLILGGVALVFFLLLIRFIFVEKGSHEAEREWFTRNLKYEFSVTVDSVKMFNPTTGRIHARIVEGNPLIYREDSLKNSFKKHEKLRFISNHRQDSVYFVLLNANLVRKGDSIRISSEQNNITVFHKGEQVSAISFSDTITGWGKAPL